MPMMCHKPNRYMFMGSIYFTFGKVSIWWNVLMYAIASKMNIDYLIWSSTCIWTHCSLIISWRTNYHCKYMYIYIYIYHAICACIFYVRVVGEIGYKASCMFLFVDIRINHLSTNQSHTVVAMCTDNEILDALSESSYIFICFCIASEDFPASNVESSKEFFGLYDAVMVDAYRMLRSVWMKSWWKAI